MCPAALPCSRVRRSVSSHRIDASSFLFRRGQARDAPVTGFFEFQLITRCKHGARENLCSSFAPRGMLAAFSQPSAQVHRAITQCFRPRRQQECTGRTQPLRSQRPWLRLHARISRDRPQIFGISPTRRDIREFTNEIKPYIRGPLRTPGVYV